MAHQVDTKRVLGRRKLHFDTLDEALADAKLLAQSGWSQLGNWSLGQICEHLAKGLDTTSNNTQPTQPLWVRFVLPWFKGYILRNGMFPGFQAPPHIKAVFEPGAATDTQAGLERLAEAVARFRKASLPARSAFLGRLTPAEWEQFHCRHAELHLSFLVPAGREATAS